MKILLLGCNGQVGWELQRSLQPIGEVIACDFDSRVGYRADFTQPSKVIDLVDRVRPEVIVNSAAYTAVDNAEADAELARLINATTVGVVSRRAAELGALFVHYSTDYVYDGTGHSPRDEISPTGPLSVYGQTKLEGEELIRASGCDHLILRTSWIHSVRGNNFIKTMLRLALEREVINVVDDQIGAPTGADLLADVTARVITRIKDSPDNSARSLLFGTFHCVAAGETSWFDYARFIIEQARSNGELVNAKPVFRAVSTFAYPTGATRPLNSRLSTAKLRTAFSLCLPDWRIGVERTLREIFGQ